MNRRDILGLLLSSVPGSVYAHAGHMGDGLTPHHLMDGFLHPFLGLDHILVMLAIGLWAGKIGGQARWQLPLVFVVVMAVSAWIGIAGSPILEVGIAASVMAVGLILSLNVAVNRTMQITLTILFAMLHGFAHGSELSFEHGVEVLLGMILATSLLHAIGLYLVSNQTIHRNKLSNAIGLGALLAGGWMLVATI